MLFLPMILMSSFVYFDLALIIFILIVPLVYTVLQNMLHDFILEKGLLFNWFLNKIVLESLQILTFTWQLL